jgi:hypothetical protein
LRKQTYFFEKDFYYSIFLVPSHSRFFINIKLLIPKSSFLLLFYCICVVFKEFDASVRTAREEVWKLCLHGAVVRVIRRVGGTFIGPHAAISTESEQVTQRLVAFWHVYFGYYANQLKLFEIKDSNSSQMVAYNQLEAIVYELDALDGATGFQGFQSTGLITATVFLRGCSCC